jgi:hypothetical protein
MKPGATMLAAVVLAWAFLCGCGGGGGTGTVTTTTQTTAAAPTISTTAAQNGAVVVSVATTTSGATVYYTVDGTTPSSSSPQYIAPFLVASNLTLKAIATAAGDTASSVTSQSFAPNIASGTLVWSDEFSNSTNANAAPNPSVWTYDTGTDCCGNNELETYCAWASTTGPCNPASPNAYVGTDGYLHIVAQ